MTSRREIVDTFSCIGNLSAAIPEFALQADDKDLLCINAIQGFHKITSTLANRTVETIPRTMKINRHTTVLFFKYVTLQTERIIKMAGKYENTGGSDNELKSAIHIFNKITDNLERTLTKPGACQELIMDMTSF